MTKYKYLISGIGPGPGGVGILVNRLAPTSCHYGFKVLTNGNLRLLKRNYKKKKIFFFLKDVFKYIYTRILFESRIPFIKNSLIVVIHPQTIGLKKVLRLAEWNEIFIYLMDNSFFCVRSYNFHPHEKKECLKCIGNPRNADSVCTPYPVRMTQGKNINLLESLRDLSPKIGFLCQNQNQAELAKMHFGKDISYEIVGMNTGELSNWKPERQEMGGDSSAKPFILFHGSPIGPKGIKFFIDLAKNMPQYRFVIPARKSRIQYGKLPINIECMDVNWETGLKDLVKSAVLVLNPSLWSAPIEGALIKSLAYNSNVATVESKFGYEEEIYKISGLLRLPPEPRKAAKVVKDFLEKDCQKNFIGDQRRCFLEKIKHNNDFDNFLKKNVMKF